MSENLRELIDELREESRVLELQIRGPLATAVRAQIPKDGEKLAAEAERHLGLAITAAEDLRMRLGKLAQHVLSNGVSCYDTGPRPTEHVTDAVAGVDYAPTLDANRLRSTKPEGLDDLKEAAIFDKPWHGDYVRLLEDEDFIHAAAPGLVLSFTVEPPQPYSWELTKIQSLGWNTNIVTNPSKGTYTLQIRKPHA